MCKYNHLKHIEVMNLLKHLLLLLCCSAVLTTGACNKSEKTGRTANPAAQVTKPQPVITGAACTDQYVPLLKGKRIALLSNQTGTVGDKHVLHIDSLVPFLRRTHVNIGIIAVPTSEAQGVADMLVSAGVKAIWNFAPTTLKLSDDILVKNENLAASLAALSSELHRRR